MVDLLGEDAAHDRSPVLERDGGVVGNRGEERPLVRGEVRIAVADKLADLPPLPAQWHPHGKRAGLAFGPGDAAVFEHERRTGGADGVHRRLHDRLQRLLQVQRLGNRLGDPGQRLELADAALRLGIQLGVLDCLRDLRRDRDQELDLGLAELARPPCADVERAR